MTSFHNPAQFNFDIPDRVRHLLMEQEINRPRWGSSPPPIPIERPATVPVPRPSHEEIQRKVANFKLVADALELLLQVWPEIPGASVTLTPAHQDELKRIILALPAAVAL